MLFLFLIWVLVELGLIVLVAELIGVFWMVVLLVASWPIGLSVMRHEGRVALRRLTAGTGSGQTPTTDVIEGALAVFAGLLFMIPGFLTDILGAMLLIGPARRLAGRFLARNKRIAWLHRSVAWADGTGFGGRGRQRYDAESTAYDINDQQIDRDRDL